MLWILLIYALLEHAEAQGQGYDYNRPDKPFANSPSRFPGTNGYTSAPVGTTPSGNGYSSPRSVGPGQPPISQQVAPNQPSAGQYPNQFPPSAKQPGQPDNFPGFPMQQFSGVDTQGFPGTGPSEFPAANKPNVNEGIGGQYPEGTNNDGQYRGDYENGDYSAIPGEPDVDYPIYSYIPETSFKCEEQQYPGYYGDVEARCQVFHICANNKMYDFLCPNGTIFHQEYLVCVWWNQFDCNSAPSLYAINANIYDYSRSYPSQEGVQYSPTAHTSGQPGYNPNLSPGSQGGNGLPSFTSPQNYPKQETPQYPKTKPQGSASSSQGTTPSYSGSNSQRRPGYPSQTPPSNGQSTAPGYPGGLTPQPELNGYPRSQPQSPADFTSQNVASNFNGIAPQNQSPVYSTLQSQGPTFTSPDVSYPSTASQTPSYPDPNAGTVAGYSGNQKPTTPRIPAAGSTYPETSYPKPQTPSPGFGSTQFSAAPSYPENVQTPYPAANKPIMPFFGPNDQQQRQYLPPVNG